MLPPMSAATPPQFLEVLPPEEAEERPPAPANFVNVSGDGALIALDFFYVPPAKLARLVAGETTEDTQRTDSSVTLRSEPVARVALPLTSAADLAIALIERIDEALPELRESLGQFASRLHDLSHGGHHNHDDEVTVADEGARKRPR
jgi:hypothetical protein